MDPIDLIGRFAWREDISSTTVKPANFLTDHLFILIGIGVGVVVLVLLTTAICCCCRKRRARRRKHGGRQSGTKRPIVQAIELQTIPEQKLAKQLKKQTRKHAKCDYMRLAKEFRDSLEWEPYLFDPEQDRCYCESCYPETEPDVVTAGGAEYVIPRGWVRLGLHVDPVVEQGHDIWNWIVTFHGTTIIAAHSILKSRQFCLPGDKLLDGSRLGIRPGHIPNKKHIYTSPTIAYSSLPVYSPGYEFQSSTSITRGRHKAQIVLQCRQKPHSFEVQPETVDARHKRLCPHIPNTRIEYYTEIRNSLVPYGLLIRLSPL